MRGWDEGLLRAEQAELVSGWLAEPELVTDLSWGQTDTRVLHVHAQGRHVIVKAAGPENHHIGREIDAHSGYTGPLVERGCAAGMLHVDRDANLLVLEYLEGDLAESTEHEFSEDLHTQAGEVLRMLHDQHRRVDDEHEYRAQAKALAWLGRDHRVEPAVEEEVRARLAEYRPRPIEVVPTHGDWQPRNWLVHDGELRVIDFGRFEFRPPATDLARLAAQQWRSRPSLEAVFMRSYGGDRRDPEVWRMDQLREAIGTAVWAYLVGDEAFEAQGHRMLKESLARF